MSVELTTYNEGNSTFLAVGAIHDAGYCRAHDELQYHAERADGKEMWTDSYSEALDFISEGLGKPRPTYTL